MKFIVDKCVHQYNRISSDYPLQITSELQKDLNKIIELKNIVAYPPLINSHDHLIGNWYPRAGENNPYKTTDIWVEEMKQSASFMERNKIWINDGNFQLTEGNAPLITQLGMYKNIFSGCTVVQDHGPNQSAEYYNSFIINVIRNYRQCHSLSLGNWWGGKSAEEEMKDSQGKEPFILHLAEGTDNTARNSFRKFEESGLLKPNTIIIHGISLQKEDIRKCAEAGTSICCCPESNHFLIGRTIDIKACLEYGVNLVIGTDSTMSGTPNLFSEIKIFHQYYPDIPASEIFKMITTNAQKALMIDPEYGKLENNCQDLLLVRKQTDDPYENLLQSDMYDIELLLFQGKPLYGSIRMLNLFNVNEADYFIFKTKNDTKFVLGHPEKIIQTIDSILGYHKDLPYLPF